MSTSFVDLALIIVSSGFPDCDLIVRLPLVMLIFSVYVPAFKVIVSPELALFTAACIEFPGWTIISAADPLPEINTKIRKIPSRMTSLFLITIPPSIQEIWSENNVRG
jgi:hypothetical protein